MFMPCTHPGCRADLNAGRLAVRDVRIGAHPLYLAAARGDVYMVRLMVSKGTFVQVRERNLNGGLHT